MTRAVHVVVTGRVQGVGYRAWTADEAESRGLAGWVRNLRDGSVEALFAGDEQAVDDMLIACRNGPPAALVANVEVSVATEPAGSNFRMLPTA